MVFQLTPKTYNSNSPELCLIKSDGFRPWYKGMGAGGKFLHFIVCPQGARALDKGGQTSITHGEGEALRLKPPAILKAGHVSTSGRDQTKPRLSSFMKEERGGIVSPLSTLVRNKEITGSWELIWGKG